jgi:hypothetical protein
MWLLTDGVFFVSNLVLFWHSLTHYRTIVAAADTRIISTGFWRRRSNIWRMSHDVAHVVASTSGIRIYFGNAGVQIRNWNFITDEIPISENWKIITTDDTTDIIHWRPEHHLESGEFNQKPTKVRSEQGEQKTCTVVYNIMHNTVRANVTS